MFRWLWVDTHKTVYRSMYSYKTFFGFPFIPEGKGGGGRWGGEAKGLGGGGEERCVCVYQDSIILSQLWKLTSLSWQDSWCNCAWCALALVCVCGVNEVHCHKNWFFLVKLCILPVWMSLGSFSLWEPTCMHCVYLALWTCKVLCGSFYVPHINFHSFIQ